MLVERKEGIAMGNLKRATRRAICAVLTAAMLCSNAGLTAYATEGTGQETVIEAVEEVAVEGSQSEEVQPEEASAGETPVEEAPTEENLDEKAPAEEKPAEEVPGQEASSDNSQAGDVLEEGGQTETGSPEKAPKEEGTTENNPNVEAGAEEEKPDEGNTEAGAEEEKPDEENTEAGAGEEKPDEGNTETGAGEEKPVEEDVSPEATPDGEGAENREDASSEESVSENDIEDAEENLETVEKAAGDIASGEYTENGNNITWVIDANGKLTVTGTGDFADPLNYDHSRAPWYDRRDEVKSAVVNVTGMQNASNMFIECHNLTNLDLSNFNTSNVTDMAFMFHGCDQLISLDLSSFNTSQVTNMYGMFNNCLQLTSLDLSNFDTSLVINMGWMFNNCHQLSRLDLSNFDTSQVTDMGYMFSGCLQLTSLDVSKFDTSQVTHMASMFLDCSQLTSLDLSSFDTAKVTDMRHMFHNNEQLTSLDLSSFNTSSVMHMEGMFYNCSNLTEINLSNFDAGKVTDAEGMFVQCPKMKTIHTPYNLNVSVALPASGNDVVTWQQEDGTVWAELPQNLDHSILITKNAGLKVSKPGTYCALGEAVNLDDLTVTYYGLDGTVRTLASSEYKTNASEIDTSTAGKKTLTITYNDGDSSLTGEIELTVTDQNILAGGEYKENGSNTTWTIDMDGKLTVEGTGEFADPSSNRYERAPWYEHRDKVKSAEVNVTGMKNASCMFYNCYEMTSLNLSGFDTSQVTDMARMFCECFKLTSLNVSKFDTRQVTNMDHMFSSCYGLTSLDVSNFDTSQVTNMGGMFYFCDGLTSLDLDSFNTSNVTNMSWMFEDCYNLTEIDLSGFDAGKVTSAAGMFSQCYRLQTIHTPRNLNVSVSLRTRYNDVNTWRIADGSVLTELQQGRSYSILIQLHAGIDADKNQTDYVCGDVLNLDDLKVRYFGVDEDEGAFDEGRIIESSDYTTNASKIDMSVKGTKTLIISYNDGGTILTSEIKLSVLYPDDVIDSGEYKENGSDTRWVLYANGKLVVEGTGEFADADAPYWERQPWSSYCERIKSAEIKVTDMTNASGMFYDCYNLESVDFSQFDTSNVTDMSYMFAYCSALASLDVSKFNTSKVADMNRMFLNCYSLASLDLSGFDTSSVTDMSGMFNMDGRGNSLASLNLKNFKTGNVTGMSNMFSGCSSLKSLDLSGFNTSQVQNMSNMFSECSGLISLNVSKFDTSQVYDMSRMFQNCSGLTSLNVGSFNTGNVENMREMFLCCTNLTDLDVSKFDTGKVTNMSRMFEYCTGLTSLDLGSFNTSQVCDIQNMFYGCNSLASLDLGSFDLGSLEERQDGGEYIVFPSDKLQTMQTPYNLKASVSLQGTWYQEDGTELTKLPQNLDHSIFIRKSKEPLVSRIKAAKGKTSYICGDEVSISDLVVIYYNEAGVARRLRGSEYTTNVKDIDTAVEGKQTLTITYRDGDKVFTDSIELTVAKFVLDADHVTITVADGDGCVYDGTPKTPEVTVVYSVSGNSISGNSISRESVSENSVSGNSLTLEKDKDYTVTYENNTNAFEDRASLTTAQNAPKAVVVGQNRYSGTVSAPFAIQKAAGPQAVEYLETRDNVGQSGCTLDLSGYFADYQKTGYTAGQPVEDDTAAGNVIVGQPTIDEKGILTYEAAAGTKGDFATIPVTVSFLNHKDAAINVKIMLGDSRVEDVDVAAPVASPESGRQLTAGEKVTLSCATAGAEIYYTTGASTKELADPAEKGTRYTEPVTVNNDIYVRAVAVKGSSRSKTVTFHYTVLAETDKVRKPYALPAQGVVEKGTTVELKSDTPDAVVYYVTGKNADMLGAVPVDDAHKYTAPIEITEDLAIKAVARKDGMKDSDAAVFTYRVNMMINAPTVDPASGTTVDQGSYISLKADRDVNIYYTTDQSDPKVSGTAKLYDTKIRVAGSAGSVIVIRAAAEKNGIYSETVTFTYTVSENKVKGLQVMLAGSEEFTYTGSAIIPAVIVTNNGEELTEDEDYTVKYSNNVKAADKGENKAPKITVTGKGNLTKSVSVNFTIKPKNIGDEEEVVGSDIVAARGKKAAPLLFYNGVKLTAKDFDNDNAGKKYSADETITIKGKGNFEGERKIDVKVMDPGRMKKFKVAIDNTALRNEPLVYDGEEKTMDGYFQVFDSKDNSALEEYNDYAVIYSKNNINAGKVKFSVLGLGEYYGTITKSYTIKPRAVKTEADGDMEVNVDDGDSFPFKNGGVTIPGLTVTCDGDILVPGRDYKAAYSSNRKICTGNKAKCTISFKGNYKGSKALVRRFNINKAVLDDVDQINGSTTVAVGDMVYTGKPGAYKSIPYVTVNGALLKSSDYKVSYYKDPDRSQVINGKTASGKMELADGDKQKTVYMKIEGKGNYTGTLTAQYNVYKLADDAIDLTKAKINFVDGNRAEYTGEGVEPAIEVLYKTGSGWTKVDANDIGTYINATYINNVDKGRATVMINSNGGKYAGSKTAAFNIVPKSIK